MTTPAAEELLTVDEVGELVDPPVLIKLLIVDPLLRAVLLEVTASDLPTKPPTLLSVAETEPVAEELIIVETVVVPLDTPVAIGPFIVAFVLTVAVFDVEAELCPTSPPTYSLP